MALSEAVFFSGKIWLFFDKEIELYFLFICFSSVNLTNFAKFFVKFRQNLLKFY
jgi:hypothetical protein